MSCFFPGRSLHKGYEDRRAAFPASARRRLLFFSSSQRTVLIALDVNIGTVQMIRNSQNFRLQIETRRDCLPAQSWDFIIAVVTRTRGRAAPTKREVESYPLLSCSSSSAPFFPSFSSFLYPPVQDFSLRFFYFPVCFGAVCCRTWLPATSEGNKAAWSFFACDSCVS